MTVYLDTVLIYAINYPLLTGDFKAYSKKKKLDTHNVHPTRNQKCNLKVVIMFTSSIISGFLLEEKVFFLTFPLKLS